MSDQWQAPGGTGQPGVGPPGLPSFGAYSSGADHLPSSDPLPSRWARLGASLIDVVVVTVACAGVAGAAAAVGLDDGTSWWRLGTATGSSSGAWVLVYVLLTAAYEVVGIGQRGRTVGKVLLRLRVADAQTGLPMTWRASGVRWAVKDLTGQVPIAGPLFGFVDTLFVFREDKRTVHDLAAGTVVLRA